MFNVGCLANSTNLGLTLFDLKIKTHDIFFKFSDPSFHFILSLLLSNILLKYSFLFLLTHILVCDLEVVMVAPKLVIESSSLLKYIFR